MSLKFGDPESIADRDRARKDAASRPCETCHGCGFLLVEYRCAEKDCCKSKLEHEAEVPCFCCDGEGEFNSEAG